MQPVFSEPPSRVQAHDRPHVVATTILAIVVDALRQWLHGEPVILTDVRAAVENTLRDEFDDIKREIAGERETRDA